MNSEPDSSFTIADFPGKNLIIEYFEPLHPEFEGKVVIGQIGQAYQDILSSQDAASLQDSLIDINCEQGKNYQNEKHAVCKITFRIGRSGYLCSGALINNSANDGTPYFLTATTASAIRPLPEPWWHILTLKINGAGDRSTITNHLPVPSWLVPAQSRTIPSSA
jgi:hypothetical protein